MQAPRKPIFVARDTYRRRRLVDALRLMPVIGLLLFLSPLVGGAGYLRSTALSGVFVFVVWFGLILATFVLVRLLARTPSGTGGDPLEPDHAPPATGRASETGAPRIPPVTSPPPPSHL